jgi:hypothetical protein
MATVEELLVRIDASTESLRRELKRAEAAVEGGQRNIDRSLKGIDRSFSKVGDAVTKVTRALGPFAAALSVGGLTAFANSAVSTADALAKTADKLGVTVEGLQELRFAAERTGVSAGTLDMAMQRFTRRVGEAATGTGELKDTLAQYNIAVRDSNGGMRSSEAILGDLADAIQGAGSDAERLRIAFKAFDSEGAALVNTLRGGSAGLEELRARARDAGAVIGEDVARQAEAARDAIDTLSASVSAQFTSALTIATAELLKFFGVLSEFDLIGDPAERLAAVEKEITRINEALDNPRTRNRSGLTAELRALEDTAERLRAVLSDGAGGGGGLPPALDDTTDKVEAAIRAFERKVEVSEVVSASLGRTVEEVESLTEVQRVLSVAVDEGTDLTQDQRDRLDDLADAYERSKRRTREYTEAEKAATKAREDAARAAEKAAEEQRRYEERLADFEAEPFLEALRDIHSTLTDTFEDAFDGTIDSLGDFADRFVDILKTLAANIASQATEVTIVTSVAGGLGLPLGGLGVPAAPGGGGAGGIGQIFGLGRSVLGALGGGPSSLALNFALGGVGQALGLSAAPVFGLGASAAGGVGAGAAAAGAAGSLTTAGSALVGAAPFIGIAAAALPLILGGFFGGSPSVGPTGVGRFVDPFDFDSGVFTTDNDGNTAAVEAVGREITGILEATRQAIGASAVAGYGFDIGHFPNPEGGSGRAAGFTFKEIINAQAADENLFEGLEADELVLEAVRATLQRGIENVDHEEVVSAINNSAAETVEDQLADLDFAQTLGEYVTNGLETPLTTVEQAFEDLEDSFDAAKDKARELGLSVSDVTDMFGELRTELVDQVSDDFTARLRAAQGNGFLNNLQGVLDQRAIDGRNATAAGLDIDATAGAIAAESFHRILEALDASQLALAAGAFTDDAMLSGLIAHYSRLAAANDNTASDDDDAVTDQPIVDPVRLVVADLADVLGDMDDALNDSIAAREAEIDAIRAAATAAGRVGRALIATADSVLIDSSLSPLSVEDRLAEARSQYEAVLARAAGEGDDAERAREELNAISRAYLDAAQDFYGSSTEYSDTFERVQTDLRSIGDAQLSIERAQLAALEAIETEIAAWRDALAGAGAASNVFGTSYTTQTDGQAISNTGMDLGADPERNLAILGLLRAAGLPTPSGFGEGQLRALREADPRVHDLLAANGFARGGAFDGGKVIPFARGGVIARPTHFPIGLMGEAGPEAIMPLRRDGAGRLGVSANTEGGAASPAVLAELKAMTTRLEAIEANTGASARTAQREAARPLRAAGGVR